MTIWVKMMPLCLALGAVALAPAHGAEPEKPLPPEGPRMGTKPEEFLMTKITVSDLRRSFDFYTGIVGLKPVTSPDMELPTMPAPGDPEKDFIEIALNYSGSMADPLFLLIKRRGKSPNPLETGMVTLGFKVPNTAAVMERAASAGIQPSRPFPAGGRVGFIKDPDGYTVEFIQPPSFEAR